MRSRVRERESRWRYVGQRLCMMPYFIVDLRNVTLYNIDMPRAQDLDFADRLGDAIVARRSWLAISQVDLAERLEVSPSQMSRYERGQDQVSALMLARIATALGTTVDVLLGYGEAIGNDASAHLEEALAILADPDVAGVVRSMLTLDAVERRSLAKIVHSFCEIAYAN